MPSDNQTTPNPQAAPLPGPSQARPPAADETGNETGMEMDEGLPGTAAVLIGKAGKDAFAARDANPPQQKFRLTDRMKELIWQLVCISNECCRLENEKK